MTATPQMLITPVAATTTPRRVPIITMGNTGAQQQQDEKERTTAKATTATKRKVPIIAAQTSAEAAVHNGDFPKLLGLFRVFQSCWAISKVARKSPGFPPFFQSCWFPKLLSIALSCSFRGLLLLYANQKVHVEDGKSVQRVESASLPALTSLFGHMATLRLPRQEPSQESR